MGHPGASSCRGAGAVSGRRGREDDEDPERAGPSRACGNEARPARHEVSVRLHADQGRSRGQRQEHHGRPHARREQGLHGHALGEGRHGGGVVRCWRQADRRHVRGRSVSDRPEIRRTCLGVSPGIAFGRAYLIGRDTLKAPRHHIKADDIDTEVARLYKAIAASDKQLAKSKEKLASENESDYHIITAHQMMLHDEHLVGAAVEYIRDETINAEWALRRAVDDIRSVFDSIEDAYLRERRSDVEFVFERVLRNLLGRDTGPLSPPPDAFVVAYDLSPADTATLHRAAVAGLITDAGGKTSHTAIIARAHEIPAVVALEDITELVETDDFLVIAGATGVVIVNPSPATVAEFREEQRRQVAQGMHLHAMKDLPAQLRDGTDITLSANIDGPDEIDDAIDYGAQGVGLFRTEYLYMHGDLPDEEMHYQTAVKVIEKLRGRPATIRTFALGADKLAKFVEEADLDETNPALGLRSIQLSLSDLD